MTPEKERIIRALSGLLADYIGSCKMDDVIDLNRRLGYTEALLYLILEQEA